jgi:methyl-accepting chemotaxis protein
MKLSTKIIIGYLIVSIIFLIISVVIAFSLQSVKTETNDLIEVVLPANDNVADIRFNIAMENVNINEFTDNSEPATWQAAMVLREQIHIDLSKLNEQVQTGINNTNNKLLALANNLQNSYDRFIAISDPLPKILATVKEDRKDVELNYQKFTDLISQFRNSQFASRTKEVDSGTATPQVLNRRNTRIDQVAILEMLATKFHSTMLQGLLDRDLLAFDQSIKITEDSYTLAKALLDDSSIPLNQQILSAMVESILNCQKAIKAMKINIALQLENSVERTTISHYNLSTSATLGEDMSDMTHLVANNTAASINTVLATMITGVGLALLISIILGIIIGKNISNHMGKIIDAIDYGADEIKTSSGQLTVSSKTLADGASENLASLDEISSALEELTSMTKRNADSALEANTLTEKSKSAVNLATDSMEKVTFAMNEIAISGNEIGKIIKTIDEIAFQTNLLALNAAVEAARAGEAGAGFAVVADEVRNLAIRSSEAAKNTSSLIASTTANINSGSELVKITADNFHTVSELSSKISQLVGGVAEASKEQAQGIDQIAKAMNQMDEVTQVSVTSTQESAEAANRLTDLSEHLLDTVHIMKDMVHGTDGEHSQDRDPQSLLMPPKAA